jgi:hypothetical protein
MSLESLQKEIGRSPDRQAGGPIVKRRTGEFMRSPLFIRPAQVPALFGISERQVRELMMRGDLKQGLHWFKKSSRMVLLSVQALVEWIKEG